MEAIGQSHQTTDMNRGIAFLTISFLLILAACTDKGVYEKNISIPSYNWHKDSVAFFKVDISDTLSLHSFYINLRHTGSYKYSNIYMFVNTSFPSGKRFRDTVECVLANDKGKWLGDGSGDVFDNQVLFKNDIRFPEQGTYIFEFEQAMRAGRDSYMEILPEIMDVGLKIERQ